MFKRVAKKAVIYFLILLGGYLVIGNFLHRVIFKEQRPEVSTYFKPGQEFYSKAEGFRQTVVKQEGGYVHCVSEIEPYAPGPPKHVHTGFDEYFEIGNGELTLWVNGEIKKLHPGEVIHVPAGTPHQPYNETGDTIRTKTAFPFPEDFAFYLTQVYGIMDKKPGFATSGEAPLQLSLFTVQGFDSYIAEGPPVFVQRAMVHAMAPMARLMGYKSFYKEYEPASIGKALSINQ